MNVNSKRFLIFEAMMALAAVVEAFVLVIVDIVFTDGSYGCCNIFLDMMLMGVPIQMVCGMLTWVTSTKSFWDLFISQSVYLLMLPLMIFFVLLCYEWLGGDNKLGQGLTLLTFFVSVFCILPSIPVVMLCCWLYKILIGRYVEDGKEEKRV